MSELSPPRLPWSNRPLGILGRIILWMLGWTIKGELPKQKKLVLIVAPHTSTWDFPIAIAAKWALDLDARWLGKHDLFRGVLGPVMTWAGGIPVNRSRAENVVDEITAHFEAADTMWLGISPEGTRSYTERWKSGFYRLALGAGIPLWCAALDGKNRCLDLGIVIDLSGDLDADMQVIEAYYRDKTAIHPDRFGPISLTRPEAAPQAD